MKNWRNVLVKPTATLLDAMKAIDRSASKFVLIVDDQDRLLGSLSDGDIRRSLINGQKLDSNVQGAMNKNPTVISSKLSRREQIQIMQKKIIPYAPIVNSENRVTEICILNDLIMPHERENPVVLMAGGPGTRLGKLTENTPKPMLLLGQKPILQLLVENFRDQGFRNIYISTNYLAEQIENHFGDGESFGVRIRYLRENKRLGTAGCLHLLDEVVPHPHIVMNADIFSQINFAEIIDYSDECKFDALMCVRQYNVQVPFGVVQTDGKYIHGIDEKPLHNFLVNAGIYVLSPEVIKMVPKDTYFDMTHLFEEVQANKKYAGIFPIHGYWRDLGTQQDLKSVQSFFEK